MFLSCAQLVKQTNSGTPTNENHQGPAAPSKKHPRSRSFGGLIKVWSSIIILENHKGIKQEVKGEKPNKQTWSLSPWKLDIVVS